MVATDSAAEINTVEASTARTHHPSHPVLGTHNRTGLRRSGNSRRRPRTPKANTPRDSTHRTKTRTRKASTPKISMRRDSIRPASTRGSTASSFRSRPRVEKCSGLS